jgi:hypothetical protein
MFREIIAVYLENHIEHLITLLGQNAFQSLVSAPMLFKTVKIKVGLALCTV